MDINLKLYEHNAKAYSAVKKSFEVKNRAAVVHPTGTGKSFIAFKLCEENPGKRICWLSPSEYIYRTQIENLEKVIGDTEKITGNITFCTYARLAYMRETELKTFDPDYIILDEFHRCGASVWGAGVERLLDMYTEAKVLGLSATSVRYLDNQRDMADELFMGNVVSHMTLGEAIVRGILNPPKYVLTLYSYQKSLGNYEKKVSALRNSRKKEKAEEYLEALKRTLENAEGIDRIFEKHIPEKNGKYIIFCSDYEAMKEALSKQGEWFGGIDRTPHTYSFYSEDPESKESFRRFTLDRDENRLKLLYCIDALNEGIHLEDINGVILMRPTVSPIVYKQQIGRALSATKNKEPVIFDIVNNIENLYSIGSVKEEMQEALNIFRMTGDAGDIVNESFTVTDYVTDCMELFDKLEGTLTASWEEMYKEAEEYSIQNGNLLVPMDHVTENGFKLGRWISVQRMNYRKADGSISEDRIKKLENIGMVWQTHEERAWEKAYREAEEYYKKKGNLDIPAAYITETGMALGRWNRAVKDRYREGKLSKERVKALESIGAKWESPVGRRWMKCLGYAGEYFREYGNLNIPKNYTKTDGKETVKLGIWISTQRKSYADGRLTSEQIRMLEEIGMSWDRYDSKWEYGYSFAKEYFDSQKDINSVPDSYLPKGFKLKSWINAQKAIYREGKLEKSRAERLESIGIDWNHHETMWDNGYTHAEAYHKEHGDLKVPTSYECMDGFKLKSWLNNQRTRYRNGKLSGVQVMRLEHIGMSWGRRERIG